MSRSDNFRFCFTRPGQKPSDRRGSGTVWQSVMGPEAANQPPLMGMMGMTVDVPRFCRHCGSPVKPGDNFCRQCGGKLRV